MESQEIAGKAEGARGKIKKLEQDPAESVPKAKSETRIRDLESKVSELNIRLTGSVPRKDVEPLNAKLKQLEDKLAQSLPRGEVDAGRAELLDNIAKPEAKPAECVPRGEAERLRAEIDELEERLAASKSEVDSLRAHLEQLRDRVAESVPRTESEAKVNELEKLKRSLKPRGIASRSWWQLRPARERAKAFRTYGYVTLLFVRVRTNELQFV